MFNGEKNGWGKNCSGGPAKGGHSLVPSKWGARKSQKKRGCQAPSVGGLRKNSQQNFQTKNNECSRGKTRTIRIVGLGGK